VTVVVPRITLSATSKHYSALYNVITDLLMYQDPDHQTRNKMIDTFMLQVDRKDREPKDLLSDIARQQRDVRYLRELVRGYDQHLDLLTDAGKQEMFTRRRQLFEATEGLFCVFEMLSANFTTEDAKASAMNASRTDIRAGSIAWNLLKDDMTSLVKLDIDGTMLSVLKGKNSSLDAACVVSDVSALNSNPDAVFPEVGVRHEEGGVRSVSYWSNSVADNAAQPDGISRMVKRRSYWRYPDGPLVVRSSSPTTTSTRRASRSTDQRLHLQRPSSETSGSCG
jgi:hypothetical protein